VDRQCVLDDHAVALRCVSSLIIIHVLNMSHMARWCEPAWLRLECEGSREITHGASPPLITLCATGGHIIDSATKRQRNSPPQTVISWCEWSITRHAGAGSAGLSMETHGPMPRLRTAMRRRAC